VCVFVCVCVCTRECARVRAGNKGAFMDLLCGGDALMSPRISAATSLAGRGISMAVGGLSGLCGDVSTGPEVGRGLGREGTGAGLEDVSGCLASALWSGLAAWCLCGALSGW
jgi:hypothetical protein